MESRLREAAEAIRNRTGKTAYRLAIVTGSGLSSLASVMTVEHRLSADEIPHFPRPGVAGHSASVFFGRIGRVPTILFAGRVHLYEGRSTNEVVFAVRLARQLGGRIALFANAAGGVNANLQPGDLVLIRDQINLTFHGLPAAPKTFFSCRGNLFCPRLAEAVRESALAEKIDLMEGVYAGMLGPSYETRAEADFLRLMGADVVGMSTVLEAMAARQSGMRVAAISSVANRIPAWGRRTEVSHAEVLENMRLAGERLKRIVPHWVKRIEDDENG